jgi:hypothetical protein
MADQRKITSVRFERGTVPDTVWVRIKLEGETEEEFFGYYLYDEMPLSPGRMIGMTLVEARSYFLKLEMKYLEF